MSILTRFNASSCCSVRAASMDTMLFTWLSAMARLPWRGPRLVGLCLLLGCCAGFESSRGCFCLPALPALLAALSAGRRWPYLHSAGD